MDKIKTISKGIDSPIPPEWVQLFLVVADLCDGDSWDDVDIRDEIIGFYREILKTKTGEDIYLKAQKINESLTLC